MRKSICMLQKKVGGMLRKCFRWCLVVAARKLILAAARNIPESTTSRYRKPEGRPISGTGKSDFIIDTVTRQHSVFDTD